MTWIRFIQEDVERFGFAVSPHSLTMNFSTKFELIEVKPHQKKVFAGGTVLNLRG